MHKNYICFPSVPSVCFKLGYEIIKINFKPLECLFEIKKNLRSSFYKVLEVCVAISRSEAKVEKEDSLEIHRPHCEIPTCMLL